MFNPNRLKVQLKLAINRLKMLQAKKASLNQHLRREIATLLDKGKVESARIRVEHIIREDLLMEAMEMLELYCDLLLARFGLIEQYKTCDPGIAEAVVTIIWASPRADEVKELVAIRDQFAGKYGKEFVVNALDNTDDMVNPRVVQKLQVSGPDLYLVERYLEEIARSYDVAWVSDILAADEKSENDDDDDSGGGGIAEEVNAEIAGIRHKELEAFGNQAQRPLEPPLLANPASAGSAGSKDETIASPPDNPPSPTLDLPETPSNLPPLRKPNSNASSPPTTQKPASKNGDDFESLAKRLEALKRK